jgi:cardiolipin synthase
MNAAIVDPVILPSTPSAATPDACVVFGEGDELYATMLADIASAKQAIRLESYIFAGDEVGWRFAKALAERARAGVHVRVHIDAAGALFEGTEKLFRRLLDDGVEARWFNRWRWRDPWHYNRRNHRKLLVVDETCLYVGGFNLHRESSQAIVGAQRWRDVHVRHSERLIDQAIALFDALWDGRPTRTPPPWDGEHRLLPNATLACRRVLHCLYLDALAAAEHSITLATPYFVPDRRFRAALGAAARRGVAVRVLLPSQSDQRLVQWASHALARPLARRGVQFFNYLPRMMHAKVTLIDEHWAMVGSANADYRSFFVNHELNLVSRAPALCQPLQRLLDEDFAQACRLDLSQRSRHRARTFLESVAHRLRRWL